MKQPLLFVFLIPILASVLVLALQDGIVGPKPAYACSGAYLDLDEAARMSDVIAIVETTAVGGATNLAPTQTPVTITPIAGFPTPNPQRTQFDLTGVGAVVRPVEVLKGMLAADARVDENQRGYIEKSLRGMEANPYSIVPCDLGFMLLRWQPNQRYLVFLTKGDGGRWDTSLRYRIAGDHVITGGVFSQDDPPLSMTTALKERFFASLPAQGPREIEEWNVAYWTLTSTNAPLQPLLDATRAVLAGEIPGPTTPTPSPQPGSSNATPTPLPGGFIAPPSVGDGGLR